MALYDVPAPAKLNLFLHVTGRRPDGYHELQTVFRFIDLCDRFDFDLRSDGVIQREGEGPPGLAAEHDLVVRAAHALQQATGCRLGAQIRYQKQIPSGAGMGGGSSDAATTLIALNRLWNTGLDRAALMQIGRRLGADVPVFVFGRSAFAEGIGDVLTEIALPDNAYLVLRPPGAVSTAQVFSHPCLTRDTESVIISVFAQWLSARAHNEGQKGQAPAPAGTVSGPAETGNMLFGRNDLEPVVLAEHQGARRLAEALRNQGFRVRMTGSGNCFFVEYETLEQAFRAQRRISSKMLDRNNEGRPAAKIRPEGTQECEEAVVENTWVCRGLSEHPLRHW